MRDIISEFISTLNKEISSAINDDLKKITFTRKSISNLKFHVNDQHVLLASLGKYLRKSINDFGDKPLPFIFPSQEKVEYYQNFLSKK